MPQPTLDPEASLLIRAPGPLAGTPVQLSDPWRVLSHPTGSEAPGTGPDPPGPASPLLGDAADRIVFQPLAAWDLCFTVSI